MTQTCDHRDERRAERLLHRCSSCTRQDLTRKLCWTMASVTMKLKDRRLACTMVEHCPAADSLLGREHGLWTAEPLLAAAET